MDLQNIQEQLNTEFAKDSTKYIFWFDDKAEYEDEVSLMIMRLFRSSGKNIAEEQKMQHFRLL